MRARAVPSPAVAAQAAPGILRCRPPVDPEHQPVRVRVQRRGVPHEPGVTRPQGSGDRAPSCRRAAPLAPGCGRQSEGDPERCATGPACERRHAQQPFGAQVALVAAEQLVATIAGERDGDLRAGQAADQQRRQLGLVGERLVVDVGELGDERERIVGREPQLGVVGAQVRGDAAGVDRLVVVGLGRADRERAGPRVRRSAQHRDDHRGVDAAGEERAQRHVGDRLAGDGGGQRTLDEVDRLLVADVEGVGDPGAGDVEQRPPGDRRAQRVGRVDLEQVAGRQLVDTAADGASAGHGAVLQELCE
jgi:hypothetical protein